MAIKTKWPLRLLYFALIILHVTYLKNDFSYMPIPFTAFIQWTLLSAIFNIGIWGVTTRFGQKWKVFSILLCLPTLIISPMLLLIGNWFIILVYSLLIPVIFGGYYFWRKYENRSIYA